VPTEAQVTSLPTLERLDLVQDLNRPQEWWVTVDGRQVVGFSGEQARPRAEHYFLELSTICEGRPRCHDGD
jgi:hypothetical protein